MNYIHLIYNKLKFFFQNVQFSKKFRICFGRFGVFCSVNFYFEYRIRSRAFFCIWEHSLRIIFGHFYHFSKKVPEV